ncbi:MAG: hypothetical protein UV97_C0004G0043 [Candidatus Yanofskybacteria bacterium GW2011_GWF2_43_596]|nr:MAG: hypothetical protein UV97_C0004G0043 [Candidatus Yanofskybacteria bacterium GW2011_GWF2_43_596]
MKIAAVQCTCGLEQAHRKLELEDGRRSRSFFSVKGGQRVFLGLVASGEIKPTAEETAATMQELDSCGLPATDVEAVAAAAEKAKSSPSNSRGGRRY